MHIIDHILYACANRSSNEQMSKEVRSFVCHLIFFAFQAFASDKSLTRMPFNTHAVELIR
jgi:hypothetical protein